MVPTAAINVVPPPRTPGYIARPALEARFRDALERRLTTVIAGAGFGKSVQLGAWAVTVRCAWLTLTPAEAALPNFARGILDALRLRVPGLGSELAETVAGVPGPEGDELDRADAFAAALCQALDAELVERTVLVLDDVQDLEAGSAAVRVIEQLCRLSPPRLSVILSSREALPFPIQRMRGRGQILEIDARSLAFGIGEIEAFLEVELGDRAPELAASLHEHTTGWPAAIRLATEALRFLPPEQRLQALRSYPRMEGPLYDYLAEEVFGREREEVHGLLRQLSLFERCSPALCRALGVPNADALLADLARRGLFVEAEGGASGWYRLPSLIRAFVERRQPVPAAEARMVYERAAAWLESEGHVLEAGAALLAAGDSPAAARFLRERGAALLASGAVDTVARLAGILPADQRDAELDQLEGQALQVRGDWTGALARFERAAASSRTLPAGLAWRMGLIHHLRGELDLALEVYARGWDDASRSADQALLRSWMATAHWLRGETERCDELARGAMELATFADDPGALAAAHTVMAMLAALRGDRAANDAHYIRALDAAERVGDALQILRIRVNRSSRFNEEGMHAEALKELEIAIPLAELSGFAAFLALGLNNRAEAKFRLGRLEEALADFRAARDVYQRIGSLAVSYPLGGMGDVYLERGDVSLALAAYTEAVDAAERAGDAQGLVPALAGLARATAPTDLERAEELAARALGKDFGMATVAARLAAGWVALSAGDRERAAALGEEASHSAADRRDRAGLAGALELRALAGGGPVPPGELVREALGIWREVGNPVAEARASLVLASLSDEVAAQAEAVAAQERLRNLGIRVHRSGATGPLAFIGLAESAPVSVQALGRFRVLRAGEPVPASAWQSKKARDLLKMLVARRGLPTLREVLMDALWPEEDPDRLANRFSVALTTVRSVLDPEKRYGSEHFVVSDKTAVALNLEHVSVDVERFLADATSGQKLLRDGHREEGLRLLASAGSTYVGDFLEEDLYEEWAVALREQARATHIAVARAVAEDASAEGDADTAVRYYLAILERDPYDEGAHLGVVEALAATGRHGESRRCYQGYVKRMEELGLEAAPAPPIGVARRKPLNEP